MRHKHSRISSRNWRNYCNYGGTRVLDAGSGQGYAARYLAETTGADVTGITLTPREVVVSEKLSRNCTNPPTFVLGDYAHTEFPNEHFDVIYLTETLSHARDMKQTMREFYRILKPGGRVVFVDYDLDLQNLSDELDQAIGSLEQHAGGFGLRQQAPGDISNALKLAGFIDVKERDWTKWMKPTFDRLCRLARPLRWIRPTSKLAPHFVNSVMANYHYRLAYEQKRLRNMVYMAKKPQ